MLVALMKGRANTLIEHEHLHLSMFSKRPTWGACTSEVIVPWDTASVVHAGVG